MPPDDLRTATAIGEPRRSLLTDSLPREAIVSIAIFLCLWQVMSYLAPTLGIPAFAIPGLGRVVKQNANVGVITGINALGKEAVLEGKKARAFPLRFVDGAVFFGPLKVGQIPPLF